MSNTPKTPGLMNTPETGMKAALRKEQFDRFVAEPLSNEPPEELEGNKVACKIWIRTVGTFGTLKEQLLSVMDQDLLTEYCSLMAEEKELKKLVDKTQSALDKADGVLRGKGLLAGVKIIAALMPQVNKMNANLERKRDRIGQLRKELYLTPRARAGKLPQVQSPKEKAADPMKKLLEQVDKQREQGMGDRVQ